MNIAYTIAPGKGDMDLTLLQLAEALKAQGVRLAGTVQINTERDCDGPCDMDVRVLPDGPVIRISQTLGKHAKGCRLDPEALERAVGHVEQTLTVGADLLVVNKFGKHEADGRGFRNTIATALADDIPVLVGLNALNKQAFLDYVGGTATEVKAEVGALESWAQHATKQIKATP
ncbi:MAG: DUF2478 domain-containing protein [Paracoccaceae bacterium]